MIIPERKHYDDVLSLESGLSVKYTIHSSLCANENYRYRQVITAEIMLLDEQGDDVEVVGRIHADKLLFSEGMNNGWDHFSIFDTEQYLMDLGSVIWDFEAVEFSNHLNKAFEYDLVEMDVLYMHTIEVLPAFRGMQVGEHAMKDMANNFAQGCALIITDCFPIQHTSWMAGDKEWRKKMQYHLFEKGKRKAKQRLIQYLKRTGFYYLLKVSKDHMFLCPARRNPNFDYIELD